MKMPLSVLIGLLVVSCVPVRPAVVWTKPGQTPHELLQDDRECMVRAAETEYPGLQPGEIVRQLDIERDAGDPHRVIERVREHYAACMQNRGYQLEPRRSEQPIDPGVLRAISACKQEVLTSGVVPLADGVSGLWTETPGPGIRMFWRCMATKRAMGDVRDENQLRQELSMAVHECDQIVQWAGLSSSGSLVTMGPGATMFWQCMSEKGYRQE